MSNLEQSILRHYAGVTPTLLEAHLRRMPESYVERFSPAEIARHLRLTARLADDRPVDLEIRPLGGGYYDICVVGFDRKGILASITSALAAEGFDIHDVQLSSYGPADDEPAPGETAQFVDTMRASCELRGRAVAGLADGLRGRLTQAFHHLSAGNFHDAQAIASDSSLLAGRAPRSGPAVPPLDLREGQRLGDFQLGPRIASGGMGVVYEATQLGLGRKVAIKVVTVPAGEADILARFTRESAALASFSCPSIVQVHASGSGTTANGSIQHWLALEFMPLGDLARWTRSRGPTAANLATRWLLQALQGLNHAHRRGVLHRDLKPHNLLLTADLDLKISDFGLMKRAVEPDVALTIAGTVMGTPQYISPEQALAEPADERSDLYSLGSSFFHILAGRPTFGERSAAALLGKITHLDPPRLREIAPGVPAPLAVVVDRLLALRPEGRYQEARVALDDLLSYIRRGLLEVADDGFAPDPPPGLTPSLEETIVDSSFPIRLPIA